MSFLQKFQQDETSLTRSIAALVASKQLERKGKWVQDIQGDVDRSFFLTFLQEIIQGVTVVWGAISVAALVVSKQLERKG